MLEYLSQWGWPQYVLIAFLFIGLMIHASMDGKPRVFQDGKPEKYSFKIAVCRFLLWFFILACGGFWG